MTPKADTRAVLLEACAKAGIDPGRAQPIRLAENALWRLSGGTVVRIAPPGQQHRAARELRLATWLANSGLPTVRPKANVHQPVIAAEMPVTFWEELPPHQDGSLLDIAATIRRLHSLPMPNFSIGRLAPFTRVQERIDAATTFSDSDRQWLRDLAADLESAWTDLPPGMPQCVVHGDAWASNVVRTSDGPVLLDLERCSIGPPEWDLTSTAVKLVATGGITQPEYDAFCTAYGEDVLAWRGFPVLRATRELRMTTYGIHHASMTGDRQAIAAAQYRVDCLRGRHGPRPWHWDRIV